MRRPLLRPSLSPVRVPGEGLFLLSEARSVHLSGRAFELLVPELDGRRGADELALALADRLSPAETFYALARLERDGLLIEADERLTAPAAAWWDLVGQSPATAAARLSGARVRLEVIGGADPVPLVAALESLGLAQGPGLTVVLTDDYLRPELGAIDQRHRSTGSPWVLARLTGLECWLGPLFVPGETGCWACLAHRLGGLRKVESYVRARAPEADVAPGFAAMPASVSAAAGLLACQIALQLGGEGALALRGALVALDTRTLQTSSHPLPWRPQCPACGDPGLVGLSQWRPPALEPSPVTSSEGGYRAASAEEALTALSPLVSDVTGVVSRLTRTTRAIDEAVFHSYATDHNFGHLGAGLPSLRVGLRLFSGGKGRTDASARASALGESIERYAGVFQGDEARLRARGSDLDGPALSPRELMQHSARQERERARWNASGSLTTWVPEPFDPALEIDWSPAWSLVDGRVSYVPTAWAYYVYPFGDRPPFAAADSNGCAAGLTLTEAVLQGFLELAERDAVALWWYNLALRPGVDLDAVADPWIQSARAHLSRVGRSLWVLDLSHDLGIPTFVALSRSEVGPRDAVVLGFGAHLDPLVALSRAVAEHVQMLPVATELPLDGDDVASRWLRELRLDDEPWLRPGPMPLTVIEPLDAPPVDLRDAVAACVERVRALGLDLLVMDQSRPDLPLRVARVIVPGLRHFWARFAPGRLYEVPVALGWRDRPLSEGELNPWPMFL